MISGTHLHAMAIHFPIALLCIGFLSAVISLFFRRDFFSQAAFYLLVLGALGSIAAYLSGNAAGEGIEEGALGKAVGLHEQAATISANHLNGSVLSVPLYPQKHKNLGKIPRHTSICRHCSFNCQNRLPGRTTGL